MTGRWSFARRSAKPSRPSCPPARRARGRKYLVMSDVCLLTRTECGSRGYATSRLRRIYIGRRADPIEVTRDAGVVLDTPVSAKRAAECLLPRAHSREQKLVMPLDKRGTTAV